MHNSKHITNALKNFVQPKWMLQIQRQQQLIDNVTRFSHIASPMLEYKHSELMPGIMSSALMQYSINTSLIPKTLTTDAMKASLLGVSSTINDILPNSAIKLSLSNIQALECETAIALRNAGIHKEFLMPSMQIAEKITNLSSLSMAKISALDNILHISPLLDVYHSLVHKQYSYIQKDTYNCDRRFEIIEVATNFLGEQIETIGEYVKQNETIYDTESKDEELNGKSIIQYIPSYLGYTMREDSKTSPVEGMQQSILYKIFNDSKEIVKKIEYINEIYMLKEKIELFKPTNKSFSCVSSLTTTLAADEISFGMIIDSLYMLLYEGSGEASRILGVLSDEECNCLWSIKHLRTDFRHDIEHGKEKKYIEKKKTIAAVYQRLCGKIKPMKQKEWIDTQENLYYETNMFLDKIISKLSNKEDL